MTHRKHFIGVSPSNMLDKLRAQAARLLFLYLGALISLVLPPTTIAATTYGQNEGLANLSVRAVVRDDQGYIWVGSEDGVQRFDGHRFMTVNLAIAGTFPDNNARQLLAVPGAMYIVTSTRLLRYDLKQQTLTVIPASDNNGKPVEFSAIAALADGTLYGGTHNGSLYSWRDTTRTIGGAGDAAAISEVPKPQQFLFSVEPADVAISSIVSLEAGASGLWISTNKGVYLLSPKSATAKAIRFNNTALNNGAVASFSIYEYPAGVLWIGYWNDALVRLDLKTQAARWFHPKQPGAGALRSTSIYSFASRADRLYIGTNRGIVVYHPACDCLRGLNQPAWNQISGSGVIASSLLVENDGLWAAVWGDGLTRFSWGDEIFQHQIKVDGNALSPAHPLVYALRATKDKLWMGTYGGGVQSSTIAQQRDGEPWRFQSLPWGKYPIESQFIWSLDIAANVNSALQDNIRIGTGTGFYNWRGDASELGGTGDGGKLKGQLSEVTEANTKLTVHSIRSQFNTQDGRHYVGTSQGLYRTQGEALVKVNFAAAVKNKQLSQMIWSIAEVNGQLWLGTARGLIRLNSDETFLALHEPGLGLAELPGAVVLVQKRDSAGNFWIGTSGGLVRFTGNADAPEFERHDNHAKLGVRRINSIEFDAANQLWMGSPNGLLRYDGKTKRVDLFDKRDGLVSDQLTFNSSTNDGRLLYFGAMGGLIAFDPIAASAAAAATTAATPASLNPRIARLRVGQGAWQTNPTILTLAHDHEPVQLELTALYFSRPQNIRYAYRWRDGDGKFTELGDAKSVVLSGLTAGTHSLEIRATAILNTATSGAKNTATSDTTIVENTAEVLTVNVDYAWYESIWGRLLLLAGLGGLLYAWTRWRTWQVDSYAKKLKADVAERTAQLNTTSAELAESNKRLLLQSRIDPLTGLANRRYLFELAHERLAYVQTSAKTTLAITQTGVLNTHLSIIMLDLDHFKKINDVYGHASGDAVLRDFAEVLKETVGEDGVAVRYGGEEFLVLLFNVAPERLLDLASRLVAAARSRKVHSQDRATPLGGAGIRYTVSIGVASALIEGGDSVMTDHPIERLITKADESLYEAKHAGRDRAVMGASVSLG